MALWTPYADDAALDLSKTAQETSPREFHHYSARSPFEVYNGFYAPTGQLSPTSSSGYSHESIFSPSTRHVTLSPPASPQERVPRTYLGFDNQESLKRPFSMLDVDSLSDDPDFQDFERNALRVMAEKNGGTLLGNNPRMRRAVRSTNNDSSDDSYRRQRERNNFAAKQSRDRRKLREIHLALKVSYLRKEVATLKAALSAKACSNCRQSCLC